MNLELQKELVNIMQDSHNGIIKGIYSVQQQAPELVNQILKYGVYKNILDLIISTIFGFIFLKLALKSKKEENYYDSDLIKPFLVYWILFCISIISIIGDIINLIQIYIAPKLFLLEYVKEFIR